MGFRITVAVTMTSRRSLARKVGSPELDDATIEVLREASMPVGVQYVADRVDIAWHQARAQLFKLAMEGKINAVDTTKSWIFTLKTETPEVKPVAEPIALHSHPNNRGANTRVEEKEKVEI